MFSEAILQQENRVQNFAILKLTMIVIVAIGQLYLLRTLLANKSQGYEGV